MDKPSILYVIGSLDIGGTERHITQIIIELKRKGWPVEIFTFKLTEPLTSYLRKHDIPVHGVALPSWLRSILWFKTLHDVTLTVVCSLKLLFKFWFRRPCIVHFFLPSAYILGGLLSVFTSIPVKIMSRRSMNHYQKNHSFLTYVESWLHTRMTRLCGNAVAVVNNLKEEKVETSRLRLIYNGINMTPYHKPFDRLAARTADQISEHTLVFIIVANLIPYKGHADLIEALSRIKHQLPAPWCLLCLGRDDGIGSTLQQQAEMTSMAENIQFLGVRHDVPHFLKMADIGILSSHQEGFTNAVLEDMAAGLPMVVTDVGGNAEAVLDNKTGYIVPAKNPDQMAQALLKMAFNSDRIKMGQQGKARVETLFSLASCVEKYEELYHECLLSQ